MKELAIDLETYSATDIKAGVHKYVEDPAFQILMISWSVDNAEPKIYDMGKGQRIPFELAVYINDAAILKTAYNAAFEIACLSKHLDVQLDPSQWSCTMVLAAQAGYPFGLDQVAKVMGSAEQKDKRGKELIRYFCVPCKPTKANGMRTRNLPHHDGEKWIDFMEYCRQDVKAEQEIRRQLKWFSISKFEQPVWNLDQKINNAGVQVDKDLVRNAIQMEALVADELIEEMGQLTNIKNPKSNAQVKAFIQEATGIEIESLNKAAMPAVFKALEGTKMNHVLKIREQLNRSSIRKYTAMEKSACKDDRIRGLFQYYGANRTGRWAGRNVQLQNLVRTNLKDLNFARELVRTGNLDVLKLTYDDVGLVLSNLIRTAFIPAPGNSFVVSDSSAIEARIVAWLAGEKWRLDVFKTHGKIYEASAAQMFKIPIESVSKDMRQKGKIAELALGYQGAAGALERMGALKMGLTAAELPKLVKQWRNANRKIVQFWYDIQDAFIEAINYKGSTVNGLTFQRRDKNMFIKLPSGRELVYLNARMSGQKIVYQGMNQTTKQWGWQDTYGGKLVENIVQAVARDVLTDAMLRADKAGLKIVMHVHDEIVIESQNEISTFVNDLLSAPISWANGLTLGAETFTTQYYKK